MPLDKSQKNTTTPPRPIEIGFKDSGTKVGNEVNIPPSPQKNEALRFCQFLDSGTKSWKWGQNLTPIAVSTISVGYFLFWTFSPSFKQIINRQNYVIQERLNKNAFVFGVALHLILLFLTLLCSEYRDAYFSFEIRCNFGILGITVNIQATWRNDIKSLHSLWTRLETTNRRSSTTKFKPIFFLNVPCDIISKVYFMGEARSHELWQPSFDRWSVGNYIYIMHEVQRLLRKFYNNYGNTNHTRN